MRGRPFKDNRWQEYLIQLVLCSLVLSSHKNEELFQKTKAGRTTYS
jgi:hypothetical protein